jgi:hypothetical protein
MDGLGRVWLALSLAILAAAGAASLWLAMDERDASPPAPVPVAAAPAVPPPRAEPPAPAPLPRIAPPRAETVDSAETHYPLADWRVGASVGGWLDPLPDDADRLDDTRILEIGGWAGDGDLGTRARRVFIAVCGRIVASVTPGIARPEIARAAHPNLDRAGWRARLAVAHLPRCEGAALRAYAQAGTGRTLLPLQGVRGLALAPPGGARPELLGPPTPDLPPPGEAAARALRVASTVNLRRCADTRCDLRGRLPAGTHRAEILDERDGWLLLRVPALGTDGWLLASLARPG